MHRDGRGFTVLYGDLDGFKPVNDRLGHHAGDEALRVLGQRLAAAVRDQDAVARIGGDEFVVLLDLAAPDAVAAAIARIEQRIRAPMHLGSEVVAIDISLGAAAWPDDGTDARTLLDAADAAMFARKRLGRADEDADEETRPTGGRAHRP